MLLSAFDVENWTFNRANIIGATTGAVNFSDNTTITDFGEDINGIKNRTYQLQRVEDRDPSFTATFVSVNKALATKLVAGGYVDSENSNHILPGELTSDSFNDLYLVGDYSDKNTGANAGGIVIIIHNAMNTAGFQWSSNKNEKGQFTGEFHGFYNLEDDDAPNYEIYLKDGGEDTTPALVLTEHSVSISGTGTHQLELARKVPSTGSVTYSSGSSSVATVGESTGLVTGVASGNTIITATMTTGGVTYTDTCTVIVTAASSET
jgi:hypothetical protein